MWLRTDLASLDFLTLKVGCFSRQWLTCYGRLPVLAGIVADQLWVHHLLATVQLSVGG